MAPINIALVNPEIPGNTGNIGRLAVGLGARLHLVRPLGFELSEKAVRRAGIDHWSQVDLVVHDSVDAFLEWTKGRRVHLFSAHGERPYTQLEFQSGDVLVFGPESIGLSKDLLRRFGAWHIPMPGEIRSLNLSNAVAVVSYHALQSTCAELF